jgi:hypothetical protein
VIRVRQLRRALGVVLGVGLALALTACSWGDPPDDVVAEAEVYAEAVRAVDGVAEAQVDVRALDAKDRPGVWVAHVVVDAASADELDGLPARVAEVEGPPSSRLDLILRFPATETSAPVLLSAVPGLEAPAAILRALPVVERVRLDGVTDSVALTPGTDLVAAAEIIRAAAPWSAFASLRLHRDAPRASVEITATTPSAELLRLVDAVSADPSVGHLRLQVSDDGSSGSLIVESSEPGRIAEQLREPQAAGQPRVQFSIHSDDDEIRGCIGRVSC